MVSQDESIQNAAKRLQEAFKYTNAQKERLKEINIRPRAGLISDGDTIENQQIDLIDYSDKGYYEFNFKLRKKRISDLLDRLQLDSGSSHESQGNISYEFNDGNFYNLSTAVKKQQGDIAINISTGKNPAGDEVLSAAGLVQIRINKSSISQVDDDAIEKLEKVWSEVLGVEDALQIPTKELEQKYKEERFRWHHKLDKNEPVPDDIDNRLERTEVFPGYFTMVERGKNQEYRNVAKYAVYHRIYSPENLVAIIKAGGLMSTHERYRRGLCVNGMSSAQDLGTGGADSVFTRIIPENAGFDTLRSLYSGGGVAVVFEPDILDRTDWYVYNNDKFGSTAPDTFAERLSPHEFFESGPNNFQWSNEQMFRLGIPVDKFKALVCDSQTKVEEVKRILAESGLTEINNKTVDEFVIAIREHGDLIDISEGKPPKSSLPEYQSINSALDRVTRLQDDMFIIENSMDGVITFKIDTETPDFLIEEILETYEKIQTRISNLTLKLENDLAIIKEDLTMIGKNYGGTQEFNDSTQKLLKKMLRLKNSFQDPNNTILPPAVKNKFDKDIDSLYNILSRFTK
jgi:hypothetical protein